MKRTALKDRHGRAVTVTFSRGGASRAAGPLQFAAALRLRRELQARSPGAAGAALCRAGCARLLGLDPAEAEVAVAGRSFRLAVPADLGAFLNDLWCIVLRDQYCAAAVKGGVVADCGANIGLFTLYALALGARRVHAFEPVRETFLMLRRNLALNGSPAGVEAGCVALGSGPGTAVIKFNLRGEGSAMIGGEDTVNAGISYSASRRVRVRPLDSLLGGRLDFLKIDTEGCEARVLAGAAGLIRRWRPVLSFAAYHREGDPRALRAAVRGLARGYSFKLNNFGERDLYCAPVSRQRRP